MTQGASVSKQRSRTYGAASRVLGADLRVCPYLAHGTALLGTPSCQQGRAGAEGPELPPIFRQIKRPPRAGEGLISLMNFSLAYPSKLLPSPFTKSAVRKARA